MSKTIPPLPPYAFTVCVETTVLSTKQRASKKISVIVREMAESRVGRPYVA
jgi:hypothetical protein